jgi:predicted nucleic-acid-binding protein
MPASLPRQGGGMLAIDTNIVVRYLVRDHPKQAVRAQALIDGNDVFVSTSVILESEWVLRSVYDYSVTRVCSGLRALAGLPRMSVENPALVAEALDLAERGVDFADALHLGSASECEAMLTFDRKFIRSAAAAGETRIKEP